MGGGHDRPMPHYRPAPEHPPLPDLLATTAARPPGHRPMPAGRPAECWPPDDLAALDHLLIPGYPPEPGQPTVAAHRPVADQPTVAARPPVADQPTVAARPPVADQPTVAAHPHEAGLPLVADWPPAPDYPAVPHYLSIRGHPPAPDWPPAPLWRPRALLRRRAWMTRRRPAAGTAGRRAAALGYLTVPVFGVPVLIYLATLRGPRPVRRHTAQAMNVWFTGLLYDLSAVIMGAMLALDSPPVALTVFAPLIAARWLVTLAYLIRAARAAGRGTAYTFPAWLCMRAAR